MPFTDIIFPQVTTTWAYQTRNRFAFVGKYKSSREMPTGQFIIKVTPEDEHTDEVPLVIGILLVPIAHARDAEFPLPVCPRFDLLNLQCCLINRASWDMNLTCKAIGVGLD